MRLHPTPSPCSGLDDSLNLICANIDALRKNLLWTDTNNPVSLSDEPITMTHHQCERLFSILTSIVTALQAHERERVSKILEQI